MTLDVVAYRPELRHRVAELCAEAWATTVARAARRFDWAFAERPRARRAWVAIDDGEVVGAQGAVALAWQQGARRAVIWTTSDALFRHDRHEARRAEIGAALAEKLVASFGRSPPPFLHASASRAMEADCIARGWRPVGEWHVAHRRLTSRRRDPFAPGPSGAAAPFAVLDHHAQRARGLPDGISVARAPRAGEMARLVARVSKGRELRPVRSSAFYSWRYGDPLAEPRFIFLGDRALRGFLALQWVKAAATPQIEVVEWEAATAVDKALLLEAAMGWGDLDGLTVQAASFTADESGVLVRLGFDLLDRRAATGHGLECPQTFLRTGKSTLRLDGDATSSWHIPGVASNHVLASVNHAHT